MFFISDYDSEETRVVGDGPYTATLLAVENQVNSRADFNSTLEMMVDNVTNGTNISCLIFGDQEHLVIYKESKLLSRIELIYAHCTLS